MRMRVGHFGRTGLAPLPEPRLLWLNTALLVLSSVAMQWAHGAAARRDSRTRAAACLRRASSPLPSSPAACRPGGSSTTAGYLLATNPANAFFYLLTALHGLHLLGGLVAWGRTDAKVWRGVEPGQGAAERRAVHRVLALPAGGLAGAVRLLYCWSPREHRST